MSQWPKGPTHGEPTFCGSMPLPSPCPTAPSPAPDQTSFLGQGSAVNYVTTAISGTPWARRAQCDCAASAAAMATLTPMLWATATG